MNIPNPPLDNFIYDLTQILKTSVENKIKILSGKTEKSVADIVADIRSQDYDSWGFTKNPQPVCRDKKYPAHTRARF